MIATDRFVYIHLHKTGGQFINKALLEYYPGAVQIGYHYPIYSLPDHYKDLPVVSFVRNPWDWYVSWYVFNSNHKTGNEIFSVVSDGARLKFPDVLDRILALGHDSNEARCMREAIADRLPDEITGNRGLGVTKSEMLSINESLYIWQCKRMLDKYLYSDYIGRTENLRQDFLRILEFIGAEPNDNLRGYIENAPKLNTSSRDHYRKYYTTEMAQKVFLSTRSLCDFYSYTF